MTESAKLNFRIARLRHQMRGTQADIRLLSSAGLDCTNAAARLARMQSDLLALIAQREALPCPETTVDDAAEGPEMHPGCHERSSCVACCAALSLE